MRSRLEERELQRAAEHVDSCVRQGYLTTDEGECVRQLSEIDAREQRGEIQAGEASRPRNSLLTKEQRYEIERMLKDAVDHSVLFLQAFESLQRLDPDLDDALRFLIAGQMCHIRRKIIRDPDDGQRRVLAHQEQLMPLSGLHPPATTPSPRVGPSGSIPAPGLPYFIHHI